jgi:Protein of unknown function (DUF3592)
MSFNAYYSTMSEAIASPYASWGKRLGATFGWLMMAIVFGTTGWFFAIKPLMTTVGNWNVARDYRPVEATIVARTGKDDGGTFNWYAARYDVAGKTYETERLTVLEDEAIDEPANDVVLKSLAKAHGEQKTATIWVSPRRPDIAVVSRDLPLGRLWSSIPFAFVFSLFAVGGAFGAIGTLANFAYYRRMHDAIGIWIFGALWCGFIFPIFAMVAGRGGADAWVPLIFVGLFALIGGLLTYSAVAISIWGAREGSSVSSMMSRRRSNLGADALATSWGKKGKPVKGNVKRGGVGERGADFDKD